MIGACPWVIPASWHIPIIDLRERLSPKQRLTRAELTDYDLEIRQAYHEIVEALLHPALPVIQNTDGDPLELTTLTYELGVTVTEAIERLTPLATLRGEVHLADETRDGAGALVTATLTWIKAGNRKHRDWDNTTLGTLRLADSRLVVEVNSARRRRRIEKEIAKCLGAAATLVDTTITDLAEALKQRRSMGSPAPLHGSASADSPEPPELEAIEAELARKHWDTWLDTKVPALGHRTPRQAAKTAVGRERLEALLADYSQKSVRGRNAFEPDLGIWKRKLGIG